MSKTTPMNRREFRPVMEDLEHLRDDWGRGPPDAVLRRGSVILRGFFCEDVLGQAWRAFGFDKEPVIVAPNLEALLPADRSRVEVAVAGGANAPGVYAAGFMVERAGPVIVGGHAQRENPVSPENGVEFPFKLSAYLGSLSAVVAGETVTRRDVVKYFANTKGGAHLELSSRVRRREDEMVRRVSRLEGRIVAFQRDGLYFELMSIGQAIAKAPDVQRLLGKMRGEIG